MVIDISEMKYPSIRKILNLFPNPELILGKEILWTVKADGSNIGVALDADGNVCIRSHNMPTAEARLEKAFYACEDSDLVINMIRDARDIGGDIMVFCEVMQKGKSPSEIRIHPKTHLVVFDIWSERQDSFINYTQMRNLCDTFAVPIVQTYGTTVSSSLQELFDVRDAMVNRALEEHEEGVVGKYWGGREIAQYGCYPNYCIYFKEKHHSKIAKQKSENGDANVAIVPNLPDDEVYKEIDKIYRQIGIEKFRNVEIAMPFIGKAIGKEAREQNCRVPKNLNKYYYKKLQSILTSES